LYFQVRREGEIVASEESTLTVMTQNLYFGAELTPVFAAASAPEMISSVATAWT
jgi:hypothetical protein